MRNQITVTVPPDTWLTANRSALKPGHRQRVVDQLHALTRTAAEEARLTARDTPVMAVWTVRYPRGVGWEHGDATNAHPTCKAILDALVKRGYLLGDGPRHVVFEGWRRGPNLDVPRMHDVVLELVNAATLDAIASDVQQLIRGRA